MFFLKREVTKVIQITTFMELQIFQEQRVFHLQTTTYIYTASFLDEKTQTRNTAHEGYGHAYFYELSRSNPSINPNHTRGIVSTVTEYDTELQENVVYPIFGLTNTTLENQIRTVENQAIYNYENRFR